MYGELKRGIHLDFHTLPGIGDFGAEFDAEKFADTLAGAGVRYLNAFAKCNLGFCYYDTKIGVKYDPLPQDLLGGMIAACHARDIGVSAYFNFGLDHEICRRRRDFCKVFSDGRVLSEYKVCNGFRAPCVNTGYGDYIYGLVDEVLTLYPELDGIFLDCISFTPCYGNECLEAIRAAGGDPLDPAAVAKHTRDTTMALLERIKARVGERNFICNSQPYHVMRHLNSHIEVECLPGGFWGYDFFPANAAYARTLSPRVMYMSGRFQGDWGDFGGLKTEASMENDLFDALSQGFSFSVGDHMHPKGALDPTVYAQIGRVFSKCREYEPFLEGARYKAEIGVVTPLAEDGFLKDGMAGAARMLGELKYGFDIVNEEMELSGYGLLILPDQTRVTPVLREKLSAFLAEGKPVLSTGLGGLSEDLLEFALPEWGFTVSEMAGKEKKPYYRLKGENFLSAAYIGGLSFEGEADEVYAEEYPAYFDRVYDGFHGFVYLPPRDKPIGLAAARRGRVAHIGFAIFTAYHQYAYTRHKTLLARVIESLLPDPLIRTDLPSTARVTLTEKEHSLFCHVKVTYPEVRGKSGTIEEHTRYPAGASVSIRGEYAKAYLLPSQAPIERRIENGRTVLTLPKINGYLCVALEK